MMGIPSRPTLKMIFLSIARELFIVVTSSNLTLNIFPTFPNITQHFQRNFHTKKMTNLFFLKRKKKEKKSARLTGRHCSHWTGNKLVLRVTKRTVFLPLAISRRNSRQTLLVDYSIVHHVILQRQGTIHIDTSTTILSVCQLNTTYTTH